MSGLLEEKTAFVTGGTGGIGAAICKRFAGEGAQIIAADLVQTGVLPGQVEFLTYDVTDEAVCRNTFAELAERWDKLDILVNAAGIEIEKTIEDTTLEEWNRIFAINVTGMFLTSKYALPLVRKSAGGQHHQLRLLRWLHRRSRDLLPTAPPRVRYMRLRVPWPAIMAPRGFASTRYARVMSIPRCCRVSSANPVISNPSKKPSAMCTRHAPMVRPDGYCQPGQLAGIRRGPLCVGTTLGAGWGLERPGPADEFMNQAAAQNCPGNRRTPGYRPRHRRPVCRRGRTGHDLWSWRPDRPDLPGSRM